MRDFLSAAGLVGVGPTQTVAPDGLFHSLRQPEQKSLPPERAIGSVPMGLERLSGVSGA